MNVHWRSYTRVKSPLTRIFEVELQAVLEISPQLVSLRQGLPGEHTFASFALPVTANTVSTDMRKGQPAASVDNFDNYEMCLSIPR